MFLFLLSFSIDTNFSFIPPYIETNAREFRQWTIRGSATNQKNFIRLTQSINNTYGAICQRMPTIFHDWSLEIEMSTHGGNGGRGFWFHFTEELCPMMPLVFNGICIWINTTVVDEQSVLFPIFFLENKNTKISPSSAGKVGQITIKSNISFKIMITRKENKISISIFENKKQETIFIKKIEDLIDFGYFTVSSLTTGTALANNDLIHIKTTPLSNYTSEHITSNIVFKNRKILEDFVESRRNKKILRREMMETVKKYGFPNISSASKKQPNNIKYNLTDALLMVNEMKNRALSTITLNALMNFIDNVMHNKVNYAYQRLEFAGENLNIIQNDMNAVWTNLRQQLTKMSKEIHTEMEIIRRETIETAKNIKINGTNIRDFKLIVKKQAKEASDSLVTKVLGVILYVEVVVYLLFFLWSHGTHRIKLA